MGNDTQDVGISSALFTQFQIYFTTSGDRESRVWIFEDDRRSQFLSEPFSTGSEDFHIEVIDMFGGRQPYLMNHEALTKELHIGFRPTAILDSNVVSYLHQYVTADPALGGNRRLAVEELLKFFVKNRLDYNPMFYYMEGVSRQDEESLLSYATGFSESILRLHTMDGEHFLTSGMIRTDARVLAIYQEDYGVQDFAGLAAAHARAMVRPLDYHLEWISKITYAALLKTALIHKTSKGVIEVKYEELIRFMEETFNIALGMERILALHYFAGKSDRFIPIQRGADPDRALRRLRAGAWDLLLLQLPPLLLVADIPDGIDLGYVCTCDKALASVARACRIAGVMAFTPKVNVPVPIIVSDFSGLRGEIGTDAVDRIREMDLFWQQNRRSRDLHSEEHISWEALERLTGQLEYEIVGYCRS